jgi:hypothetical protein
MHVLCFVSIQLFHHKKLGTGEISHLVLHRERIFLILCKHIDVESTMHLDCFQKCCANCIIPSFFVAIMFIIHLYKHNKTIKTDVLAEISGAL